MEAELGSDWTLLCDVQLRCSEDIYGQGLCEKSIMICFPSKTVFCYSLQKLSLCCTRHVSFWLSYLAWSKLYEYISQSLINPNILTSLLSWHWCTVVVGWYFCFSFKICFMVVWRGWNWFIPGIQWCSKTVVVFLWMLGWVSERPRWWALCTGLTTVYH